MKWILCFIILIQTVVPNDTDGGHRLRYTVFINKCCRPTEIIYDKVCKEANTTDYWKPNFRFKNLLKEVDLHTVIGFPKCGRTDLWPVYDTGYDRLRFLTDGTLRHFIVKDVDITEEELYEEKLFQDYKEGFYCMDKEIDSKTGSALEFAIICVPKVQTAWKDVDLVLRKIVNPIFHVIALICYITVAHIHFVLPQLRDLFGNIVATVNICLAVTQAADLARIVTDFGNPMTNFIADVALCFSILSAYLWLTGLGFYLWRTFRSENVFLRMTHGRKYFYYSCCIWSMAVVMTVIAVFAHFVLDVPQDEDVMPFMKIGWLVIAIFYFPIALCIVLNAFFYQTTSACMKLFGRYGRIHHKFRICVQIFGRLHVVMSIFWAFMALSWLPFNGVYYSYIVVNALVAPIILYVSVLSQRRVRFLLRKECCFEKCACRCLRPNQPDDIPEWGEEMMAIYK